MTSGCEQQELRERGIGPRGPRGPQLVVSEGSIRSIEDLRSHLQWAIELEHATLPSYLCALYSIDGTGNAAAADIVHSVFLEEMLHLALAANLLNAVGGAPVLDDPRLLPSYPRQLPHSRPPIEVPLVPFGRDALKVYLSIERPCASTAPPQSDGYETIGQFYEAIRLGILTLVEELGPELLFSGDPARQVSDREFRGGPGRIFKIHDLDTALAALRLIVEQGEGVEHLEVWDGDRDMFHPERDAVGHYYRFRQLLSGREFQRGDTPLTGPTGPEILIDWDAVRPMAANPKLADHAPDSAVWKAQMGFNIAYCNLLDLLEQTFNGAPQMLARAIPVMFQLRALAVELMSTPVPGGSFVAGPTFEYVEPAARR